MDFEKFPEWNPFIRSISGEPTVGKKLEIFLHSSKAAKGMTFKPTLLRVNHEQELRWIGRLGIPGLFDGEHIFTIKKKDANRVVFSQQENFKGLFVPIFSKKLERETLPAFKEMNHALKKRAEKE